MDAHGTVLVEAANKVAWVAEKLVEFVLEVNLPNYRKTELVEYANKLREESKVIRVTVLGE